ncbi:MAG TPA: hypothetical protein DCY79_12260 [Planctomycetaceae bacterium]|nr:hypothetical protein [Blastopirellula sp.]HAY80571.1 hypothetical protein [Planctomycetaceae bacterium]
MPAGNDMIRIEKITSELFPTLYSGFLHDDDPLSDEQDWRNVFDYAWDTGEGHCGYAMLDDDELVGMMGMVFSERQIAGTCQKFCNLHTWWVREDYRGHSLLLLRPVLQLRDYTVTHFTPCDRIRAVTKRIGFEELDLQLKILLPVRLSSRGGKDCEIWDDPERIRRQLPEDQERILQDHLPYRCGHLLVSEGGEQCYLLYAYVVRHRLAYCHIHYVSNRELFLRHERTVRAALHRRHRAWFTAVDQRLFPDVKFHASVRSWTPSHALFKSSEVTPEHIDHLYSDVTFLRLTVLPDMSYELSQMARRLWSRERSQAAST